MVKIYSNGKRITYTRGDTFLIGVSPEDGDTFPDGATLDFIIAYEPTKDVIVKNTYNMADGAFAVTLANNDTNIDYGRYVYKMILKTVEGIVLTQMSGDFEVIWGA